MVCAYLSLRHALLLTALYASFSDITMAAVTNLSVPVNIDPQQPSILGLRIADELSWSTHATLFGSRLHASIKSPSSLKLSLALAKRWDQTTPSRSVGMANVTSSPPSIGCTTYKRGQKLEAIPHLHQLIVRQLHVGAIITTPTILKIHHSVYKLLDGTSKLKPGQDLTVTLLGNSSTSISTISSKTVSLIKNDLLNYNFAQFDKFFWTSPEAMPTISQIPAEQSLEVQTDLVRMLSWRNASNYLEVNYSDRMKFKNKTSHDPCGFQQLRIHVRRGKLVFPRIMMDISDAKLERGCIAYIAVVLSSYPSTWLVAITERTKLFNFRARSIVQNSSPSPDFQAASSPYTDAGLTGGGQIVSVADTGLDVYSCYFYDYQRGGRVEPSSDLSNPITDTDFRKVVQYSYLSDGGDTSDTFDGHGSHVAGIIAGSIEDGDIYSEQGGGIYGGVAPDAKIAFLDMSTDGGGVATPNTVEDTYLPGYSAGSRVHTNSWGDPFSSGDYYDAADLDKFLYDHPEMVILFAAGNDGQDSGGDGYCTCSMQAQAKNVVTVGASETTFESESIDNIAFYSSKGPTVDGRIKPDIVGPGDSVFSVQSQGDNGDSDTCSAALTSKTGTSMASPAIAGAAALIRQYFMDGDSLWSGLCNGGYKFCRSFEPSGVLTKAILIHSGSPMRKFHGGENLDVDLNGVPDMMQGYGRVTLSNVLPLDNGDSLFDFDLFVDDLHEIGEDSSIEYAVDVIDDSVPLKVTLSWYDPPGNDGTNSPALVHDLDLVITSPSGETYFSNGGDDLDSLNNNEQIHIDSGFGTGTWKVVISSQALPYSGQQLFSLIITSRGSVATGDDNGGEIYDDGGSDNYEDADDRRDDDEST